MPRRVFIILFLSALILRLAAFDFFILRSGPEGLYLVDATHYLTLAKNIADGNGFSLASAPPYAPDVYRVPGYPLYLAVFYKLFGAFWPANLLQVFLNALVPVLILWLAWKVSGSRRAAYVAAFLTAVEPHLIYHQIGIATEGIFIFLLALFAVATVRYLDSPLPKRAFAVGALFAVSTITRPYFLYFLPIVIVLLFLHSWLSFPRKRESKPATSVLDPRPSIGAGGKIRGDDREKYIVGWKKALVCAACFLVPSFLILFPWMLRNERTFGVFTLSTSGWYNIYTRLAVTVYAAATHQPFNPVFNNFITQLKDDGVIAEGRDEELYAPRVAPELKKRALAVLRAYPLQTLLLQPLSLQALFTHDNLLTMLIEQKLVAPVARPKVPLSMALLQENPLRALRDAAPYFRGPLLFTLLMRVFWLALFACAIYGAWVLLRKKSLAACGPLPLGKGELGPVPPLLKIPRTSFRKGGIEVPEGRRIYTFFLLTLIVFFALMTLPIGAAIDARMRMVFEPIYFIFVAVGVVFLFCHSREGGNPGLGSGSSGQARG